MAPQPFRFKHFTVAHDRSTHKVGTDGVLLGSWVDIRATDQNFLDIGTGSGVIALMLAQRAGNSARIDALEIHPHDAQQARENVARSPWPEKIAVHTVAAQNFETKTRYDLIVSNPPFFVNSLLPPDQKRTTARHTLDLSFVDLLFTVTRLIRHGGRFGIVLPHNEATQFIALAERLQLYPYRITSFRTRPHKPVERMLMEFSHQKKAAIKTALTLYGDGQEWSEEYRSLTGDFYLRE